MTLLEIESAVKNLQKDVAALAGRNYAGRIDNVKSGIQTTNNKVEDLDREIAETALALTELIVGGSEDV